MVKYGDLRGGMDDRKGCSDVQSSSWCGQLKRLCDCTCADPGCTSDCPTTRPETTKPAGDIEYAMCS